MSQEEGRLFMSMLDELERLRDENELLKQAAAASLPDDGELITEDWNDINLSTDDTEFIVMHDSDGVFIYILEKRSGYVDNIKLPAVRTRGDVRQLVRLLGME